MMRCTDTPRPSLSDEKDMLVRMLVMKMANWYGSYFCCKKPTALDNINILSITRWGRAMHICVKKLTIIGRRQAIIWTNAGMLLIRALGRHFSEMLCKICKMIFIQENAYEDVVWKMASIRSWSRKLWPNLLLKSYFANRPHNSHFWNTNILLIFVVGPVLGRVWKDHNIYNSQWFGKDPYSLRFAITVTEISPFLEHKN